MKKIFNIILIGLIAGVTYKFLEDKNFNPGDKLSDIREWIVSKSKELESLSKDDKTSKILNDNSQPSANNFGSSENPNHESKSSGEQTYGYIAQNNRPNAELSISHSSATDSEAEEYLIAEKQFPGSSRFPELDKYARETTSDSESNIEFLTAWLIRPASNELEKARLLFTWIATHVAYDDNGFNTGNYSDTSPEGVLRSRVSVCQGYSELFTALCKQAGLEAMTINGYAKGITYRPGDNFNQTNHAWNAVKIDGEWKLFDVTWASGYGTAVNGRLVSKKCFEDYWFNVSPDEFIFTHMPEDESWQFNHPRITLSQFEGIPYASSQYFKLGFNGSQCFSSVLNGTIEEFPMAFEASRGIKVLSMPFGRRIASGKTIKIWVKSEDAVKTAYESNGRITDMSKEGDEFTAVVRIVPGPFRLMANFGGDPMSYETVLAYEVK